MQDERATGTTPAAAAEVELDLVRVLVVEDDPHLRALARTILEGAGCRVATAADGDEALRTAHDHPPDVVVLDIGLPGLRGTGVATALRTDPATAAVRLVVVTGSFDSHDLRAVSGADPHAVVRKPYDPDDLVEAVLGAARAGLEQRAPTIGSRGGRGRA